MTKSNFTSLDIEGHDGSSAGLYIGGTLVTTTAAELNNSCDFTTTQTVATNTAITVKNGVALLTTAGPLTTTLALPVSGTDDFKRLRIFDASGQAHTVAIATTGFGGGGANFIKATFSGIIGDSLSLIAYGGIWYVTGVHQVTFGVA